MRRIACLYAPAFPLQVALRAEPALEGAPLVVTNGLGSRARVVAASPAAIAAGVRVGMSTAQARAAAGEIEVRARSEAALRSASDALVETARAFAARVERGAPDLVYLEVGDTGRLFPREAGLCAALEMAARKVGLTVRVGVAGTKAVARLAALRSGDGAATTVPPGEERAFLAPLPVALASPSPELAEALERLGIRTLGELAALEGRRLGRRLGREGVALWALARGSDDEPLCAEPEPETFAEGLDLDWVVAEVDPLAFVLSGILGRLCARLEARGLACAGYSLELRLAPRGTEVRAVSVAAPTVAAPVLVTLARLALSERPPPSPVRGVRVVARAAPARPAQLALFGPALPAPAALATTVARLASICGDERVGAPSERDSHRPEAAGSVPFEPSPPPLAAEAPPSPRTLGMRRVVPPRPARVALSRSLPVALDDERVTRAAGPFRLASEWWSDAPFDRDYYDLETATGAVYRVYRDRAAGGWFVDGVYD